MLAHAMAHVTLPRPPSDNRSMPLIFIGGSYGLGPPPPDGSVVPMSVFKTQRENETRADAFAIQAMSAASFNPEALTAYIARVQLPPERAAKIFAVLADRDTRVAALRQAIAELPARTYPSTDPDEFSRIQEQVRGIRVEDRPRPTLKRPN